MGDRVPFPDVVNTLAVPADGYAAILAKDPNGAAAQKSLDGFDAAYTQVMANLDSSGTAHRTTHGRRSARPSRAWAGCGCRPAFM